MKKQISTLLVLLFLIPSISMAKSNADHQFDFMISSSSLVMQTFMFTSGEPTSLSDDEEAELRVVQDDAKEYLAGGEMTDSLAQVIEGVELLAIDEGKSDLIGNPERIALEILRMK